MRCSCLHKKPGQSTGRSEHQSTSMKNCWRVTGWNQLWFWEDWTEKHRNIARKLVLERGWVQKKLFDIGWSDESDCQTCQRERHRTTQTPSLPKMVRVQTGDFRGLQKVRAEAKTSLQKRSGSGKGGIVTHTLSGSQ